MMEKVELEACPLCGGDELSHGHSMPGMDGSEYAGRVQCNSCGLVLWKETEAEAIAAWNQRAATDADLTARIKELTRERDEAHKAIAWANNSLFGSHGFFLSTNGGEPDEHHLNKPIEKMKAYSREQWRRAEAAEQQLADTVEEVFRFGFRACVARPLATMDDDPKAEDDAARAFLASLKEQRK